MLISSTIAENTLSTTDRDVILATTKSILRLAPTDTTQDTYILSYIDQASTYLQMQTGLAFAVTAVTEVYGEVKRHSEIKALRAPIVATTKFGRFENTEVSTAAYQRGQGWRVLVDQCVENGVEITYTAGVQSIAGDIRNGVARCAVCLFESDGKMLKNTLFHRRRTLVL